MPALLPESRAEIETGPAQIDPRLGSCDRVAFLYGEAARAEAGTEARHVEGEMGRISQAIGYALSCLILAAPIEAAPLKVIPSGAVRPEQFYAIPVGRISQAVLAHPQWLREKITCCSWGPHGLAARPDTSPGQWYVFPVCRHQLVLSPVLVEAIQTQVLVSCP